LKQKETILVTGSTGLVGFHLLLALEGQKVRALYRSEKRLEKVKKLFDQHQKLNWFDQIDWFQADILDIPRLQEAFQEVNYVYHCAAKVSFDPRDAQSVMKNNIEGTANVVNIALSKEIQKMCYVSSMATLGSATPQNNVITEETDWNPEVDHSDYALSKFGAEMEVWRAYHEGLNVVIVNPGVIFGEGFPGEGSQQIIDAVKKGNSFYTLGYLGIVNVQDVVKAMLFLMQSDVSGERYSLVAKNYTYKEIFEKIAVKYQSKKPTIHAKPWITGALWRTDSFVSFVFRTKRNLTKSAANSLHLNEIIDSSKIKALGFEFSEIQF
jgi:dihydroflavonol-4-reductase